MTTKLAPATTAETDSRHHHAHEHTGDPSVAASSASVALDVGEGRGALVIYPEERFRGREIEISRAGGSGQRTHTGVHERATQAGSTLTAIFGSLPAADYVVWEDETTAGATVTVLEGTVAELRLS